MSSKLQLTTLAVLVSAALPAQAALYKVVEVTPGVTGAEYYGTAIQPSDEALNISNPLGCFDASVTGCEDYALAGETRNRAEGFSYREEVPFAMDNSFTYIEDNYDGFEDYCFYQLGYATCEYWAGTRWDSWNYETYGVSNPYNPNIPSTPNVSNSLAFIEGSAEKTSGAINTVINSLDPSGQPVGNFSTSSKRNEAFSAVTNSTLISKAQSRAWASDGTYTVGSISSTNGIDNKRYDYSSAPAIWSDSELVSIPRAGGSEVDGDYYAQGSMRDLYVDKLVTPNTFYGVGYNNYNDQHMNATIFTADIDANGALTNVKSTLISGAQVDVGGDNIHSNSVATNINKNLVAVGQAKRSGGFPQNGAAANRLFVVPDITVPSPEANFLSGGIFFNGAGGQMGGINNFNEIVGRIDSENHREYEGKQRRQRAFIYPYGTVEQGSVEARQAIFKNKPWFLDDLTNGGSESNNNNQYRIYDASDINDAGVISATAVRCYSVSNTPKQYDSTAHNAYCDNGDGNEKVVAVKLVPIALEKDVDGKPIIDIQPRGYDSTATERQGAGFGLGALTMLGLFGFMRKRIK